MTTEPLMDRGDYLCPRCGTIVGGWAGPYDPDDGLDEYEPSVCGRCLRRVDRIAARRRIVQAANRFAARLPQRLAPYTMRHVQRCAGICRRFALVDRATLTAAGYRPGAGDAA